jgi:hypothetical protein
MLVLPLLLQALLIVIGNPDILKQDPNWHALLLSCQRRGATAGAAMPDLHEDDFSTNSSSSNGGAAEADMLEKLMSSLTLGDAGAGGAAAAAEFGLQEWSALIGEAGAGMVRHE